MKPKNLLLIGALTALGLQSSLMAQSLDRAGDEQDPIVTSEPVQARPNPPSRTTAALLRARSDKMLQRVLAESDLVFRGTVRDIQYVLSEPSGQEETRIPYTFVTYLVDDVIHGNTTTDTVTLQFVGGLDKETMRYMSASGVPQFDLGDEDILFVRGNTERQSPLVGERRGRLRIVDGRAYTETGRALTLGPGEALQYGARHALDEVATTTVHGDGGELVLRHRQGPDIVDGPSNAITVDFLIDRLRVLGSQIDAPTRFVNAVPGVAPTVPDVTPATPPASGFQADAFLMEGRAAELERQTTEVVEVEPQRKSEF